MELHLPIMTIYVSLFILHLPLNGFVNSFRFIRPDL